MINAYDSHRAISLFLEGRRLFYPIHDGRAVLSRTPAGWGFRYVYWDGAVENPPKFLRKTAREAIRAFFAHPRSSRPRALMADPRATVSPPPAADNVVEIRVPLGTKLKITYFAP